jgi:predicted dehydrogenase
MFAKGAPGTARIGSPRVQEPHPRRFTFPDSKRELRATGVYAVALILRLTGERVASVYGFTANYFFEEHQRNGAEDFGLISMQLESGVSATVAAGRIGVQSHPGGGPMQVTLVGEHGSVTLDAARPRLEVFCDEPVWSPPPSDPSDPMSIWRSTQVAAGGPPKQGWLPLRDGQDDAVAFVDCLVSGARPAVTARDGAAAVETLMAAYVSASRGQPVVPAEIDWPAN